MNLHDLLMEMGSSHTKIRKGGYSDLFHFNLKTKTLKNGNTVLVDNGKIIPQEIKLVDGRVLQLDDHFGEINEEFFRDWKTDFINIIGHFRARQINMYDQTLWQRT